MLKRGYHDLKVWQKAMEFVDAVYVATRTFPKDELYGLTSQIRRSATSIPSNLAEGATRSSTKEFIRFVEIAKGSLAECETQLLISLRQAYVNEATHAELCVKGDEIGRMMSGLISKLEQKLDTYTANRQPLVANN